MDFMSLLILSIAIVLMTIGVSYYRGNYLKRKFRAYKRFKEDYEKYIKSYDLSKDPDFNFRRSDKWDTLIRPRRERGIRDIPLVKFASSYPRSVRPGEEFVARFLAFIEELETEIERKLQKITPRSDFFSFINQFPQWKYGTKVKVKLTAKHLDITSNEEEFIWRMGANIVEFNVAVPKDAPDGSTILKFEVLIAGIVVGKFMIDLEIKRNVQDENRVLWLLGGTYRKAFASYASADRARVLDRSSEIKRNGVDVFLDCLSIRPGDQWKPVIEKEINECESFMLFWSSHAKESHWVTWEWKTALAQKGLEGIDLHPLVPVHEAPPPEELQDLHFGDPDMIIRDAYIKSSKK